MKYVRLGWSGLTSSPP
ncbi:MAG: hypothetical protein MGAcid_13880 [uncultured Acidilobus sp. MG]|jgi:hypothetical protein|nr:MAG: hypothetical protein MGAcid_13880 [uncultured Acidilobus sp. MG]